MQEMMQQSDKQIKETKGVIFENCAPFTNCKSDKIIQKKITLKTLI